MKHHVTNREATLQHRPVRRSTLAMKYLEPLLLIGTTWLSSSHGFLRRSSVPVRKTIVTTRAESKATLLSTDGSIIIEGNLLLTPEFERRCQIDTTIQALQVQLPLTLTKPLTAVSARAIFDFNTSLAVWVDPDEIDLFHTRDELVALSDVLVLATSAANSVFGDTTDVTCQIILDPSCQSLLIPWTARVPVLPGPSSSSSSSSSSPPINTFDGLSEFRFNAKGKIQKHVIRKLSWNGQSLNGPAIGQALKALQSTMTNLQNSPLWGLVGRNNDIWTDLRDGLLEQVATTVASSRRRSTTLENKPSVIPVKSLVNITGFIPSNSTTFLSTIPLPGTDEWKEYTLSHEILIRLCEQVIPLLSTNRDLNKFFSANATLIGTQGSGRLLQGREALSQFFQGLSLARRSTGGTWVLQKAHVLNWKSRKIALDYVATNNPWTIRGQDLYTLDEDGLIHEIQQTRLEVTAPDGSVSLDGAWLMKNLALAVERSKNPSTIGPNIRDLFADVLFQQQGAVIPASTRPKVSEAAAAKTYYFMSELHQSIPGMWNATLPPGADYLADTVELKGYLGEILLRGSTVYTRAIGSLLTAARQSSTQKRLLIDSDPRPRVELTKKGKIRLSLTLPFRIPPPLGFPDAAAVPLIVRIVSDYKLDSQTGLVVQHQLVETRVNGQLTPGDVLSRNLQRMWNREQESVPRSNDDLLQSVTDAVSWLRTFSTVVKK